MDVFMVISSLSPGRLARHGCALLGRCRISGRRLRRSTRTTTAGTRPCRHAHQLRVVGMVGFDRNLDDVAILSFGILLDIDTCEKFDAVQFMEPLDTAGSGGLGTV